MFEGNLFKIKEGKVQVWQSWCKELNSTLRKEAIETIREEGNIQEAFILFEINGQFYTIGLGEGENLPATDREINRKHKSTAKECLEKIGKIECLYNLKVTENEQ